MPRHQGRVALPTDVRDYNRAAVMQRLFRNGPMSRAELAREVGLTKVTMSVLVGDLIAEGVVTELGSTPRPGTPGKRPTMVALCEDQRRIIAVDLTREGRLTGALLTLTGERIEHRVHAQPLPTGEEGVEVLIAFCRALLADAKVPVLGIGISSPGIVTPLGRIVRAPKRGWFDLPLQDRIAEALGLPVIVANDANCAALGEYTFGVTSGDNVLSVLAGDGIGAGLVVDGVLALGSHNAAGEIAHITATDAHDDAPWPAPRHCACGRVGCLETLLSEPELRAALEPLGEEARVAHLAAVGRRLGRVLAPAVALLNLSDIVLSGPHDLLDGPLLEAMRAAVSQRVWPDINQLPVIRLSELNERAPLIGASALVLAHTLGIPRQQPHVGHH